MSERTSIHEMSVAAEVISGGMVDWLKKVNGSDLGFEEASSEYSHFMESLTLPYQEPSPQNGGEKVQRDPLTFRSTQFLRHYEEVADEAKDMLLGQQIFWTQTYIAHLFRLQNMLQATGEEDYFRHLQAGGVAGIDIPQAVDQRLEKMYAAVPPPAAFSSPLEDLTVEGLAHGTTTLNERYKSHIRSLHDTGHLDAGEADSPTIVDNLDLQAWWAGLVVEYAVFGAAERGGKLGAVPFLDPASTSEKPILLYPFAGR